MGGYDLNRRLQIRLVHLKTKPLEKSLMPVEKEKSLRFDK